MENAVDPVADAYHVLEGLDVDVRGPQLYRLGDHQVDQADNRRAVFVQGFVSSAGGSLALRFGKVDRRISKLLEHGVGRFTFDLGVVLVDRLADSLPRRQGNIDLPIQDKPQLFDGIDVIRV